MPHLVLAVYKGSWVVMFGSVVVALLGIFPDVQVGNGEASVPIWTIGVILIGITGMSQLSRKIGSLETSAKRWDETSTQTDKLANTLAALSPQIAQITENTSRLTQVVQALSTEQAVMRDRLPERRHD